MSTAMPDKDEGAEQPVRKRRRKRKMGRRAMYQAVFAIKRIVIGRGPRAERSSIDAESPRSVSWEGRLAVFVTTIGGATFFGLAVGELYWPGTGTIVGGLIGFIVGASIGGRVAYGSPYRDQTMLDQAIRELQK